MHLQFIEGMDLVHDSTWIHKRVKPQAPCFIETALVNLYAICGTRPLLYGPFEGEATHLMSIKRRVRLSPVVWYQDTQSTAKAEFVS